MNVPYWYSLLGGIQSWMVFLILYALTIGVIIAGRDLFEGLPYNVSLASQVGDIALIAIVMIAYDVYQGGNVSPGWYTDHGMHRFALSVYAVILAVFSAWMAFSPSGTNRIHDVVASMQHMDLYHLMFVVPTFCYLLATSAPAVWYHGTGNQKVATVICFGLWLALLFVDWRSGRLEQRKWLADIGIYWSPRRHY